ncbi:tryptophan-rich sensory protein [Paeniglutamicibacter sulfureus]|uniref:Tryptophan-rich sensory protein n=1 Tax=Paeniglutamicibacter sulfureus TaxID=43666 RepID=A0ABU2BMZ1_9MICC|nr:tryptophan-rich sensory protein [Paeniglutamicibacter sulfureus]MDO2934779.1 tryptophan-rich sensory protein [Paeniglutamicibacter sulfureus]MDR7359053.1 tryptophan-rich sensory protein [Paeniglutamicibacter sulfureus]
MHSPPKASWTIRIVCAAAVFAAIAGAFIGSGAMGGTPIAEAADGSLGADSTLLAPGTGAFSIWSLVYLGLVVYAIWQLTPRAARSDTQRRIRPLAAGSAVLNALWIGVVQVGWLGASVVVMLLLLAVLARIFMLMRPHIEHPAERWIMALTFGPYLGWVSVATVANIAAWLAARGVGDGAEWATPLACVLAVVAALIGAMTVVYSGGRIAAALAMVWGIAWIGVGRGDGGLESMPVSVTAYSAATALLLFALVAAARRRVYPAATSASEVAA